VFFWYYNISRLYNPTIFELSVSSKVVRLFNLVNKHPLNNSE
jgi:hypothetical protein